LNENNSLRSRLSERPLSSEIDEKVRKIEELEKIIELLKYELQTLKISGNKQLNNQIDKPINITKRSNQTKQNSFVDKSYNADKN